MAVATAEMEEVQSRPNSHRWQHILLVDEDARNLAATKAALDLAGYAGVTASTDPRHAEDLVRTGKFDLVLTERSFGGYDGFDLLRATHAFDPRLPVLVTTAASDVATAVEALRLRAADFLLKPVDLDLLVERVDSILESRSARRGREVVLAIGAHPDDVEIGAGAALLAHRARGDRVAILVMSVGERGGMALVRSKEAAEAADLLGAELMLGTLEDTRIPDHGPAVDLVEESVAWVGATRIYTHSAADRHQDHRNTHRAVMIASRRVPRVYGFQSPSATIDYRPTRFESIDEHLERKLALIACHRSQIPSREYLDDDFIVATARYWSRYSTSRYVEAFEVLRDVQGVTTPSSPVEAPVTQTPGHRWAPADRSVPLSDADGFTEAV